MRDKRTRVDYYSVHPGFGLAVILFVLAGSLLVLMVSCESPREHDQQILQEGEVVYTCPMHPEVESGDPEARCPECGMNLVVKEEAKEKAAVEPLQRQASTAGKHRTHGDESKRKGKRLYHCPMHPTYTSDRPGECPICGMDFVPVDKEDLGGSVEGQAAVRINPARQQLIGMKTARVEMKRLTKAVRTVGHIAYDPELFAAQEEYLTARRTLKKIRGSPTPEIVERAHSLVASSRLRLNLLGLSDAQIQQLEVKDRPDSNLLLGRGGTGKVWLYADIYEFEFGHIRPGQAVEATTLAYPGHHFKGKVVAIDPLVNPRTRSARVRAHLGNPKDLLKPDMFMNVKISINLGSVLVVPESAVMFTGTRKLVFLDQGEGRFQPRELVVGIKVDDYFQVLSGLEEGDRVVVSGNFLVDAESKLKAALSQMAAGGEEHGKQLYHCPMHPTYTSDRPGECPICGMDFVPVKNGEEH